MDIVFNDNIISLFLHKPYNFNYQTLSKEELDKEYDSLRKELGYDFKVIRPGQNHTNNVRVVDETNIDDEFKDVDGLITNINDVALVVTVADCQGILLYDKEKDIIGNVHSGWKGTLNRIGSNAIKIMVDKYNSNPEDIVIYISPCIHKCHFEVDEDLKENFENEFKDINLDSIIEKGKVIDNKQKYFIDTVELNRRVFMNLGIKQENIFASDICSYCNDEVHSYRKDKPNDGRNITFICKKNN